MKGVERTKGVWAGSGNSGRKARRRVERKIRKAARKIIAASDSQTPGS